MLCSIIIKPKLYGKNWNLIKIGEQVKEEIGRPTHSSGNGEYSSNYLGIKGRQRLLSLTSTANFGAEDCPVNGMQKKGPNLEKKGTLFRLWE